jgi:hypothetical protein
LLRKEGGSDGLQTFGLRTVALYETALRLKLVGGKTDRQGYKGQGKGSGMAGNKR